MSRYRALLETCLAPLLTVTVEREGPPTSLGANIFAGAPGSTVPAHVDRHHNLLLQLEGTKELTVGWFADPVEQARAVEMRFSGGRPNPDRLPTVTRTFELGPGDGVYIPGYAFHWVRAGDAVSVALSCGFSTAVTDRAELVHRLNLKLRRLGLRPRPPGASQRRDHAKATVFTQAQRLRGAAVSAARRQPAQRVSR